MSSASVTSTRSMSALMGHVCSRCQAIVLQSISVEAKYTKSYYLSRSSAVSAATEGSLNALKAMVERINSCSQALCVLEDGYQTGVDGLVTLHGVSSPCPCCGMLEPWQDKFAVYEKRIALDKKHFPIVLDEKIAPKWVQLVVSQFREQIDYARKDIARIRTAAQSAEKLWAELDALSSELRTLPVYERRASLSAETAALTARSNALRFSDFKEKREIGERLRAVKKELEETEAEVQRETARVKGQIAGKRAEYRQMAAVAYGYTGKVTENRQGNAIYYEIGVDPPP